MLSSNIGTAGSAVKTPATNLAIDSDAVFHADAANNIAIGTDALDSISGDADDNIAIGVNAGTAISTGDQNVLMGTDAGAALTTSGGNTAIGKSALSANTGTADVNTCIGKNAGQLLDGNTQSSGNTLIGANAGIAGDVDGFKNNVVVGYDALNSTNDNAVDGAVAIGYNSLTALTTGAGNTMVGYSTGATLQTGASNTAVGHGAFDAAHEGSDSNVAIGYNAMGGSFASQSENY